ncbi:MAG: hypothetical protein WAO91_06810 [Candidatus Nitrosotenuis sp.]
MQEFDLLNEKKVEKLAKNQSDVERILPRLTTYEISLLIEKIDTMIISSHSKKTTLDLIILKDIVLRERHLRKTLEVS